MKHQCINGLLRWTAACLLLAAASSVVLGDDVDDEFGEPMPTRYLTIRVGEYGMGEGQTGIFAGVRALSLTYNTRLWGFGLSAMEWEQSSLEMGDFGPGAVAYLPLRCRFNLVDRHMKTGLLYNSLPSCYAELAVAGLGLGEGGFKPTPQFYWRASFATEVEYCGFGLGLETGVAGNNPTSRDNYGTVAYLELKACLVTGSLSLGGAQQDR